MKKKIFISSLILILVICIIVLTSALLYSIDSNRVKGGVLPKYCIKSYVYENESVTIYTGLGYKVIDYKTKDNTHILKIGNIFMSLDNSLIYNKEKNNIPENNKPKINSFVGEVIGAKGHVIDIKPNLDEEVSKLYDEISVNTEFKWNIGDKVKVIYDCAINETYPSIIYAISIEEYPSGKLHVNYTDLKNIPKDYTLKDARENMYLVLSGAKIYGENNYPNFIANYNKNLQTKLTFFDKTKEESFVIFNIEYDGNKVNITIDNTRDNFAEVKEIKNYTYNKIVEYKYKGNLNLYAFNGYDINDEMIENNECLLLMVIN